MDEEGMQIDIADAIGKATAAVCIQAALINWLIVNKLIEPESAATISGGAFAHLIQMKGLPDDVRTVAEATLLGLAKAWMLPITRN